MSESARPRGASMIPAMRYKDAAAAIEWLCKAFGFEKQVVVEDGAGGVAHAQLTLGNGMVMLGSERDDDFSIWFTHPSKTGGAETRMVYVTVPDVDAHYQTAKAAGARVIRHIQDERYGGRSYTCQDVEGYIWTFDQFDPWALGK